MTWIKITDILSMFRLTFLGTSSGIPTKQRNVSSVAVESMPNLHTKHRGWLLVDCGEGTQHQLLKSHLSLHDLSAILITHAHGDHCYGLGGLLASMSMIQRKQPLIIIAPKAIGQLLDTLTVVSELHLSYSVHLMAIEDDVGEVIKVCLGEGHDIYIRMHELSHRMTSYGFEISQVLKKDKLLIDKLTHDGIASRHWNAILKSDEPLRVDDKTVTPQTYKIHLQSNLKIVIAGDNDAPELLSSAMVDCQALVHEATYTDEVRQKILTKSKTQGGFDPKHSSAKMVAQFAQAHGIPRLILTHFSPRYAPFDDEQDKRPNMGHIRAEAMRYYQGELVLASDFMQVIINSDSSDELIQKT